MARVKYSSEVFVNLRIAIMQPIYLPWLGYFELIENCDTFVYFDDVQYVKKTFQRRNKIKTKQGELLLTVPVLSKGKLGQKINETCINNDINWRKKHFNSIKLNYCKAPYYNDYIGEIGRIYDQEYTYLLELDIKLIELLKKKIGIKTNTILSSQLKVYGEKDKRIINICKKLKANTLYNALGAKEILDKSYFKENDIELIFQNYKHPTYKQQWGEFISNLSVLDLLMNEGPNTLEIINAGGISRV